MKLADWLIFLRGQINGWGNTQNFLPHVKQPRINTHFKGIFQITTIHNSATVLFLCVNEWTGFWPINNGTREKRACTRTGTWRLIDVVTCEWNEDYKRPTTANSFFECQIILNGGISASTSPFCWLGRSQQAEWAKSCTIISNVAHGLLLLLLFYISQSKWPSTIHVQKPQKKSLKTKIKQLRHGRAESAESATYGTIHNACWKWGLWKLK
jgi:hypothetical protein